MPHVIVKIWPGPTEAQKTQLAEQIERDVVATLGSKPASVSIAIEEVEPENWKEAVYRTEIEPVMDRLYKKPGYAV